MNTWNKLHNQNIMWLVTGIFLKALVCFIFFFKQPIYLFFQIVQGMSANNFILVQQKVNIMRKQRDNQLGKMDKVRQVCDFERIMHTYDAQLNMSETFSISFSNQPHSCK